MNEHHNKHGQDEKPAGASDQVEHANPLAYLDDPETGNAQSSTGMQGDSARSPGKKYRVLEKALLRTHLYRNSQPCGSLAKGQIHAAKQVVDDELGTRVQFKAGWSSIVSSKGVTLLEEVLERDADYELELSDFWAKAAAADDAMHGHDECNPHANREVAASNAPNETHDWEMLWYKADPDGSGYLDERELHVLFGDITPKRGCFQLDFETQNLHVVEPAKVAKLWLQMVEFECELHGKTNVVQISKASFLHSVADNEEIYDRLYSSHLTHDWDIMFDDIVDDNASGTIDRDAVVRMFRLANDKDHAGTSSRIITYYKMKELWGKYYNLVYSEAFIFFCIDI